MGDLISRQAVLDLAKSGKLVSNGSYKSVCDAINGLPSVEPERKTGKWIVEEDCEGKTRNCICDQCGHETGDYTWENPNYCENCGAKMEVDE